MLRYLDGRIFYRILLYSHPLSEIIAGQSIITLTFELLCLIGFFTLKSDLPKLTIF